MNRQLVYCDTLTWRSAVAVARARPRRVAALDPLTGSPSERLGRAILRAIGCEVGEPAFFTGHLQSAEGVPLFVAASRAASGLAIACARRIVARQPLLTAINEAYGAGTLVLYLARRIVPLLERQVLQIQVVEALSKGDDAVVYLGTTDWFDPDALAEVSPYVEPRFYRKSGRLGARLRTAAFALATALRPYVSRLMAVGRGGPALRAKRPGVLLSQEEDLGSDPSYRRQPHWVPAEGELPLRAYVMARGRRTSPAGTSDANVVVLDSPAVARIDREAASDPLRQRLRRQVWQCLRAAGASRSLVDATALTAVIRLLGRARVIAAVCRRLDVRVMVFGELYLLDSDAMCLIARGVGARTVAYQYSNLAYANPIMLTTADVMALWSKRYAALWNAHGFRPGSFAVTGYPYDFAFPLVSPRAREARRRLTNAGASFVLCYFDENVSASKYGYTSMTDHEAELATFGQALLDDPSLGLVFKSQFRRNSPTLKASSGGPFAAALRSGRIVDLHAGTHRNIVLPAEAAQAADIAIGQVIGGTAAVEAVLAGARAILVEASSLRTASSPLYDQGHIVFTSLPDALNAVERFRKGDPAFQDLGDWTRILPAFDAYRDGGGARRLRELVESLLVSGGARASGPGGPQGAPSAEPVGAWND